jgi:tetratricopeptide (TPR) repeat protein
MSGYCKSRCCDAACQTTFSITWATVVVLVMAGCQNADDQLALAEKYVGDDKHQEAMEAYDTAIELKPDHAIAYHNRGLLHVKLGQNDKAFSDYDKAIELDDSFPGAYRDRGRLHLQLNDFEQAIADFSRILELEPDDSPAFRERGLAYSATSQLDKALQDFDKAISLDAKDVGAWQNRGGVHAQLGNSQDALRDFSKVIELKPDDKQAYIDRGTEYSKKGDFVKAITDFDKVIELEPDDPQAYVRRASAYSGNRDFVKAIGDFHKAIELDPEDSDTIRERGWAQFLKRKGKGNSFKAIEDLSRAIEANSKDATALNYRGQVLSGQSEWDKAIEDFDAAIKLKPKFYEAFCNRGSARVGKGEVDEAVADFNAAIKLNEQDALGYLLRGKLNAGTDVAKALADFDAAISRNSDYVEAYVLRSQMRLRQAAWDQAIQDCNKVLELDPKNADAHLSRGMALNGKRQYDSAIKDFDWIDEQKGPNAAPAATRADAFANRSFSYHQKGEYLTAIDSAYFALLAKGDHSKAHNYRAMAYIARSQFDKAIASLNQAIRFNPEFAEAYSNRGYAYGAKNNFDRALADLNKAIELQPQLAGAFQYRGLAHVGKGDLDQAIKDFDEALRLKADSADALCDRGFVHGLRGDMKQSVADLDKAIQLKPGFAKAHFRRGLVFLELGNHDKSIGCFDEAIRLKKDYAEGFCFRGYAYHAKQNFDQAMKDYNEAVRLTPGLGKAYYGRSLTLRKLTKKPEADADLDKAIELDPAIAKANPRRRPKPKPAAKPAETANQEQPLRFLVTSKGVDPVGLSRALASASEIDRLVEENYRKHDVKPNPKTTDAQFVRRIYLDVTGTIPTYRETKSFLDSADLDKREQLIDQLLISDGYSSHFFNYWADVLRYTDRLNGNVRGEPYRQWIKQSLAENKPWDTIVNQMLTSEGLIWKNPATGYVQRDAGMPLDNMNNTVRIFLGTRIGCAQCHDHPFDRWKQKEFYQMAAFTFGTSSGTGGGDKRYFAGGNPNTRLRDAYYEIEQEEEQRRSKYYGFTRLISQNMQIVNDQVGRKIRLPHDYAYDDAKPKDVIEPKALFGQPVTIKKGEAPRKAFARWLASKDNPRFALTIANRLWKQAFGVGQIEPVDDMMDDTVAENPVLMTFLESEMKRLNFDMKEYLRIVFNSQTYQRQASFHEVHLGEVYHFPGPILRRMTAEQAWDSFLTLTLVNPYEYREFPSNIRTDILGVDLDAISATDLLDINGKISTAVDSGRPARQKKFKYKGVLLARASELPSPTSPNHFLRMFGQSNRELISSSSKIGSVPQVLFMFNGPITHMLLERGSMIHRNILQQRTGTASVEAVFMAILNRRPDKDEAAIAIEEIKKNGVNGWGNVVWSLVNTREFLFIQ